MSAARLIALPSLYVISIWLLYLNPSSILPNIPTLPFLSPSVSVQTLLPLHPTTLVDSFLLGKLEGKLATFDGKTDEASAKVVAELLAQGATDFNRPNLTRKEISNLEEQIREYEQERGVVQRVKGLFSFINLVWLLSICGIVVAVGPVIAILAKPLINLLIVAFTEVIIPLLIALKPVYELLAYVICFLFVSSGLKVNPDMGFFISLTGALLFIPSFMYSTALHASGGGNKEAFAQLINFLVAAEFIPIAIMHQSSLLGFLAVVAVYGMLGFSVVCTGLCYYVGFKKDEAMPRVMVTSTLFMVVITVVKVLNIPAKFLLPFTTGLMTMGSVTYFLACLILSSYFYRHSYTYGDLGSFYVRMQLLTIFSLVVALFVGSVYSIAPLFNTACTFTVLYAMEKSVEFGRRHHVNIWFAILTGSVVLYVVSLFLHNHPGFIVSMVDGGWVL